MTSKQDIPQFKAANGWKKITSKKSKKSCRKGDVTANIFFKVFAAYIAELITNIINCCIKTGKHPKFWKIKMPTPIPKTHPTSKLALIPRKH